MKELVQMYYGCCLVYRTPFYIDQSTQLLGVNTSHRIVTRVFIWLLLRNVGKKLRT